MNHHAVKKNRFITCKNFIVPLRFSLQFMGIAKTKLKLTSTKYEVQDTTKQNYFIRKFSYYFYLNYETTIISINQFSRSPGRVLGQGKFATA